MNRVFYNENVSVKKHYQYYHQHEDWFYFIVKLLAKAKAYPIITETTHHPPPLTFKCLRGDLYSSVIHHWNRQLKPYLFALRKNRVNWSHLGPPLSVLGLINIKVTYTQV